MRRRRNQVDGVRRPPQWNTEGALDVIGTVSKDEEGWGEGGLGTAVIAAGTLEIWSLALGAAAVRPPCGGVWAVGCGRGN
ncbi:hypothetical protein CLCR_02682 [Cladophialophora carrionii]|uniref:Uncharacterized protein n=1 Tax=Cladophialophora carrionii TaxID=86049 RepID=A0A1C1CF78_9EURO|nr:hypothetical protein CLCR_02682 [Cladophialophora carrionii]